MATTEARRESDEGVEGRALGPDSVVWRRTGDWRLMLVAGRTLLLQVGHPVVAAGVAQHSDFAADPWRRLVGTLELYVGGVVFGWPDGAVQGARRLREMHKSIKGVDAGGQPYHALEPEAFHWVHATLVDGIEVMLERFGRPLRGAELARFYDEMRGLGMLYGLRDRDMPPDWPSFRAYVDEMVRTRIEDNEVVHEVLDTLARVPPPPGLRVPTLVWRGGSWPARHVALLATVGLLPQLLRERWRLSWTRRQEAELRAQAALVRRTFPLLPARVRLVPWAYSARRRARLSPAPVSTP